MQLATVDTRRPEWMVFPPETLKEKTKVLKENSHLLRSPGKKGKFLREMLKEVNYELQAVRDEARQQDPQAFFKPSFEQSLILNCWLWGIQFIGVYTANRIGKTTAAILNVLLNIFPNKPEWANIGGINHPYVVGDESDPDSADLPTVGNFVHVLPRPHFELPPLIHDFLQKDNLQPNPRLSYINSPNEEIFAAIAKRFPEVEKGCYPYAPINRGGTVWVGAPDNKHHEKKVMPMWRNHIPSSAIHQFSTSDREITLKVQGPKRITTWEISGLSFESTETKWSSGAVDMIMLTEGVTPAIMDEVKARFKDPGCGTHDFTPFEPANAGQCTALAQRIAKGTEGMPLPTYCFTKFSIHNSPDRIITKKKKKGLIDSYRGKAQYAARVEGEFFSSSALVLSNLSTKWNVIHNVTIEELKDKYPTANVYRSLDPGYDHPTACVWALLTPTNQWIIYRIMSERGLSIDQRCERIIQLSNNERQEIKHNQGLVTYRETYNNADSEIPVVTFADWHCFKIDEVSGLQNSLNYIRAGLIITESTHKGPKDRVMELDNALATNAYLPDLAAEHQPIDLHTPSDTDVRRAINRPPGARVFFLHEGPGIVDFLAKMEGFYWERYKSGERKGQPKDELPEHGDDELDAVCQLVSSPNRWTNRARYARIGSELDEDNLRYGTTRR